MASQAITEPILITGLHRPRLSPNVLARPRLLAQLDAAADSDVILICAPAGYGKTTLAADWLAQPGAVRAAWVSLNARDNKLNTYLRYVIAAVRQACGDVRLCAGTQLLLEAGHTPAASVFAETLIADLSALDAPLILALDDYHLMTKPAIRQVMEMLIQHTPPMLRLLLITRTEPEFLLLTRLRSQHRVAEIRASDLRFLQTEARAVLERTVGTTVSREAADLLETQTEGWIIGLQMAGFSLRGQENQLQFAQAFRDQGSRMVTEYLFNEVLVRQPVQLFEFLLKTSILDRLSAGLCASLLGESAGTTAAQGFLDSLMQANLFLISLDPQGEWYRYHNLFRALLVRRLRDQWGDDEIATLHRRAGTWLAGHGFVEEALYHLVIGGDTDSAATLVEEKRHETLNGQQVYLLERWLDLLPEEVVHRRPALLQLKAWVLRVHFQLAAVAPLLKQAEALGVNDKSDSDHVGTETLRGERDALRCEIAFWQNDVESSLSLAQSALARLPVNFYFARGLPAHYQLLSLHTSGETEQAVTILSKMLDDERFQHFSFKGRLMIAAGGIYGAVGDLWRLEQTGEHLLRMSRAENQPLNVSWAHFFLGHVCYQYNRLEEASTHWSAVQALLYHSHFRTYHEATLGLALIQQLQGDLQRAQETLASLGQILLEMKQYQLVPELDAFRARLALLREDFAVAAHWAETGARANHIPLWFWETSDMTRVKVHLARGSSADLREAEAMLDAGELVAERTRHTWLLIQVWALRAVLATKQGRSQDALEAVRHALSLAEPAGYIRLLVDMGVELQAVLERLAAVSEPSPYLGRLLQAFDFQRTPGAATLSERELQVLLLLRNGLSNREVAQRLVISVLTVKKHNRNIYRKLGVSGRQQAVARATEVGLLL